MLDLFVIFSKGGIVFWCFQGPEPAFAVPVNSLIKTVILQERGASNGHNYKSLRLQYKLDNEFELVFVIGYQKILQLSYIDKLLDDIQRAFAERYRSALERASYDHEFDFDVEFETIVKRAEEEARAKEVAPKKMKTFGESKKFAKTKEGSKLDPLLKKDESKGFLSSLVSSTTTSNGSESVVLEESNGNGSSLLDGDKIKDKLAKLGKRGPGGRKAPSGSSAKAKKPATKSAASSTGNEKKVKQARVWSNAGSLADMGSLDHSNSSTINLQNENDSINEDMLSMVGKMKGELQSVGEENISSEEEEEEDEEEEEVDGANETDSRLENGSSKKASGLASGVFSFFKGLAGGKTLTKESIGPVLEKMKEHLIMKNVAADISEQLCDSVATKLEGKVLGTFTRVTSTVKSALHESLMQILSPRRRVDILRDVMESKKKSRPYVITFCGVNGVGKSTNLAKICFWLLENGLRVMIAACDTFRAGAVEQLRTHRRSLAALHPPDEDGDPDKVLLYEKGYGKDSASIAMDAIRYARDCRFDVVLIDTAGRMQDNEPLMRALAKLIKINNPDLVLFVGEALVGNEAVDQLKKFNRALADFSDHDNPHLIDGILLTKFDTIDDKVGAAISMTYTTGQPIVFVGTGQTYTDLKSLNARAVVHALLKA